MCRVRACLLALGLLVACSVAWAETGDVDLLKAARECRAAEAAGTPPDGLVLEDLRKPAVRDWVAALPGALEREEGFRSALLRSWLVSDPPELVADGLNRALAAAPAKPRVLKEAARHCIEHASDFCPGLSARLGEAAGESQESRLLMAALAQGDEALVMAHLLAAAEVEAARDPVAERMALLLEALEGRWPEPVDTLGERMVLGLGMLGGVTRPELLHLVSWCSPGDPESLYPEAGQACLRIADNLSRPGSNLADARAGLLIFQRIGRKESSESLLEQGRERLDQIERLERKLYGLGCRDGGALLRRHLLTGDYLDAWLRYGEIGALQQLFARLEHEGGD